MSEGKVGDFFVEFGARGMDAVAAAFAAVARDSKALAGEVTGLGKAMKEAADGLQFGLGKSREKAVDPLTKGMRELEEQTKRMTTMWKNLRAVLSPEGQQQFGEWFSQAKSAAARTALSGVMVASQGAAAGIAGLSRAIMPVAGGLLGMATAGVMASNSGQILGYQFAELSRQVASLFVPVTRAVISTIQDVIVWFQRLSGEQQQALRYWGLLAGGIMAASVALPLVAGMLKGVAAAMAGLRAMVIGLRVAWIGLNALFVTSPLGLILLAVGAVLAVIIAATTDWQSLLGNVMTFAKDLITPFVELARWAGTIASKLGEGARELVKMTGTGPLLKAMGEGGMRGLDVTPLAAIRAARGDLGGKSADIIRLAEEKKKRGGKLSGFEEFSVGWAKWFAPKEKEKIDRQEETPRLGGFEQVEQTYRRIAEASIKVSQAKDTPAEQAVEQLKQIWGSVERIDREVGRNRNPNVR